MNKFFDLNETLVASELWDFLSGDVNTMEEILEIINSISTTEFLSKYQLLCDNSNKQLPEYLQQLQEWNLFSEIELIQKNNLILQNIANNRKLNVMYNKAIFDNKGNYNFERYNTLIQLCN